MGLPENDYSPTERLRLLKGAFGSLLVHTGAILVGLGTSMVLGRLLGAEGFGNYTLFLVVFTLVGLPIHKGLRAFVLREVSAAREAGDTAHLAAVLGFTRRSILQFSLIFAALVTIAAMIMPGQASFVVVSALLVPLLALLERQGAFIAGLGHPIAGQIPEQILRHLLLILMIATAVVSGLGARITPQVAMALSCSAIALSLLVTGPFLRRALAAQPALPLPGPARPGWFWSMCLLSMIAGLAYLNQRIDLLVIAALLDTRDVGIYRIAGQVALLVVIPQIAINRYISPAMSAAFKARNHGRMQRLLAGASFLAIAGGLPLALTLVLFDVEILTMAFGGDYAEGAASLSILTLGYLASAVFGSVGVALTMTGHERDAAWGMGIAVASNLMLNVPMVLWLGMPGAAIATAISLLIWNAFLAWRVHQRTGLGSSVVFLPFLTRAERS
ncbi:polysaccharide biosynthesis C-terminal domain-containing protein [Tropicimonas sp. TH_r6]|uniref:oligosaccharide flippase family protein n=1 Tax=Tropicimonas sp. TH_r6 TaxID=3082085 RepID=UPI00295473C7|nr:polysaccharide biosynthesis C-terminal domain-containing protein [Tropicimonas sp. TH_r6]MDV7144308.1 polysaccharide biosynthesis C-terminal domain-containing protein [Tropicimonas sp. TH_r6]